MVHTYDVYGRPGDVNETIDGLLYPSWTSYDALSRPLIVKYPSGLKTKNIYTPDGGQLTAVADKDDPSHKFWTALTFDARGNVTFERLGNGVETTRVYTDATGRLDAISSVNASSTILQNLEYDFDKCPTRRHR